MHDPVADLNVILAALDRRPSASLPPDLGSQARTHVHVIDDIVVKFDCRHGSASMVRERTALELLAGKGVPVPSCIAAGDLADGRRWVAVERLPGEAPPDATRPAHEVSAELAAEMGTVVARLHRVVEPPGFGTWTRHPDATLIEEDQVRTKALFELGRDAGYVSLPELEAMARLVDETRAALEDSPQRPVLAHRDVQPRNVLVVDGHLSALIDFESAAGGDPANDFAVLGLDWNAPGFAAYVHAYAEAGGRLGDAAAERVAHYILFWALAIYAYLAGIAPAYLPVAREAVARLEAGERPDLGPL